MLSRGIWKELCDEAKIWYDEVGSLHMAYDDLEEKVLNEFFEASVKERNCELFNVNQTIQKSKAVVYKNLRCSVFSKDEMIVDPREAILKIPAYLSEKYDVQFKWNSGVTKVFHPNVWVGKKLYEADEIFICSGADFESLFPELYADMPLTKCKLQMMRVEEQQGGWRIGPALCGGLSLIHYKSFEAAPSLLQLKEKYKAELPEYLNWGIHVMVSQNQKGELTIGDSHEYGNTFDPFDKVFINEMMIEYLSRFVQLKNGKVVETWNGIYPKPTNGETEIVLQPQNGITIINGLGGAGMTLSFGLCEQIISSGSLHSKPEMQLV
jgi:FAD dependent oxidoreductase TIGR03364